MTPDEAMTLADDVGVGGYQDMGAKAEVSEPRVTLWWNLPKGLFADARSDLENNSLSFVNAVRFCCTVAEAEGLAADLLEANAALRAAIEKADRQAAAGDKP